VAPVRRKNARVGDVTILSFIAAPVDATVTDILSIPADKPQPTNRRSRGTAGFDADMEKGTGLGLESHAPADTRRIQEETERPVFRSGIDRIPGGSCVSSTRGLVQPEPGCGGWKHDPEK